jgi:hypothetical protein
MQSDINIEPVVFIRNFEDLKNACAKLVLAIEDLLNEDVKESDEINRLAVFARSECDKAKRMLEQIK